jgi:hypothetical protein
MLVVVLNAWVTDTNRCAAGVQHIDDSREVRKRPGQPVHFIDYDHVDLAGLRIGEEASKTGSLHRAAGISAIVVSVRNL